MGFGYSVQNTSSDGYTYKKDEDQGPESEYPK